MAVQYARNLTRIKEQQSYRDLNLLSRKLGAAIAPVYPGRSNAPSPATIIRWATVTDINSDGTVDLTLDGAALGNIPCLTSYVGDPGDVVALQFIGNDCLVLGAVAQLDVPIGGLVAADYGPAGTTDVINTSLTMATVSAPMIAGHTYLETASGFGTVITAAPAFINMTLEDSVRPWTQWMMTLDSVAYDVGDVLSGSASWWITPTTSSTHTVHADCTTQSPGAIRIPANAFNVAVVRVA